jgi:LacI family transcriptional regulator
MNNKTIRIKDIALKAKVSVGTVDRVIHNRGKVAEKVRLRIQRIIDESNYEPNLMARALGSKKQYRFAALIPDHEIDSYWQAPKAGIELAVKELKQYGVSVEQFVFNPFDVHSYVEKAAELTASNPEGIFLSPIFYHETLPFFEKMEKSRRSFCAFQHRNRGFRATQLHWPGFFSERETRRETDALRTVGTLLDPGTAY